MEVYRPPETPKHQKAFEAWYQSGRNFKRASDTLNVGHMTLRRWAEIFDWPSQADQRDQNLRQLASQKSLETQADMLERHYEAGAKLLERGLEYLRDYPIDNAKDAILAIKTGIEIQRRNQELPDWIVQITSSSDQELVNKARLLIEQIRAQKEAEDEAEAEAEGLTEESNIIDCPISANDAPSSDPAPSSNPSEELMDLPSLPPPPPQENGYHG